ncbi:MAG: hypothetical protein JJU28_24200 [Cyclobacteriaceae bacterium]|nr:hypothetical protein [Cyclobacteriaceae bacterium]
MLNINDLIQALWKFPIRQITIFMLFISSIAFPCKSQHKESILPFIPFQTLPSQPPAGSFTKVSYLDALESLCSAVARHQNEQGAIIDPFLKREHQYSTPYFAFATATLLHEGRAPELKEACIKAMDHATLCFSGGYTQIPDAHGEFFISPLTHGIFLMKAHVPPSVFDRWYKRMQTPLDLVLENFDGRINNWRTYAMKGEWSRAKYGLVSEASAVEFIEKAWREHTQRIRIVEDRWNLYQDWSSDPQSLAVEAVGRVNLIALLSEGYDGPSSEEMWDAVRRGTQTSLFLQSPDGQAPANGRTDNHVFNDLLYLLCFELMSHDAAGNGDMQLAGQYQHAASLAFSSMMRWQRMDPPWEGSFFITKNFIDPGERVGYQPASQWGNYSGAIMQHLAEAWLHRFQDTVMYESPTITGGYALHTDPAFSSFFANAGGMQVVVNLRGASVPKYNKSWTPLGVIRFSRKNWDARLGPSDGEHDITAGTEVEFSRGAGETADIYRALSGVTFGPEWVERNRWLRIADVPLHYRGHVEVEFEHPLLVKFAVTYSYVTGRGGPYFRHEFTITPDGVFTRLSTPQKIPFGLTLPLLENDGRKLINEWDDGIAAVRYSNDDDEQNFIILTPDSRFNTESPSVLSSYGWLKPLRVESSDTAIDVFIYPRKADEPKARELKASFKKTSEGFQNILHRVVDKVYVGLTIAGGEGIEADLDGNGKADIQFSEVCRFILQLKDGKVLFAESDRDVQLKISGQTFQLKALRPLCILCDE